MRAVVCTGYGPPEVLQLRDVADPAPTARELRIHISATAVTSSDCIMRRLNVPATMQIPARLALGLTKPRKPVLGMVFAGEVDAIGRDVSTFGVGDEVFGIDRFAFGAYAEYKCVRQDGVVAQKPSNLSYEQAAAIPYGGLLAMWFLAKGNIRSGQRVLIYGASGAVGTAAVQVARHFGADVTAVCSTANLDLVRSLGAGAVVDYTTEDFTTKGQRHDLVFVAVGNRVHPPSRAQCARAMSPHATYVAVDRGRPELRAETLLVLAKLAEAGELKPVIDRCYPLEQIAAAHAYVDAGHTRGTVVIRVT